MEPLLKEGMKGNNEISSNLSIFHYTVPTFFLTLYREESHTSSTRSTTAALIRLLPHESGTTSISRNIKTVRDARVCVNPGVDILTM